MSATSNGPKSRLREGLNTPGKKLTGTFMMLGGVRLAQCLGATGLDAVIVDCEHGHIDDKGMHEAVLAIAGQGCSPIVRVRAPDMGLIKRTLDAGAHGLMVPMVNTAEQARAVVSMSKFPPLGIRGQGSQFSGFAFNCTIPEYVKAANKTVVTMVQIETREGVENVDEIATVEGVDHLFVGPNDLALSMLGYTPATWEEPEFLDALQKVVDAAHRNGKTVGILAANGDKARALFEQFDFVVIGGDVKALAFWFAQELGKTGLSS